MQCSRHGSGHPILGRTNAESNSQQLAKNGNAYKDQMASVEKDGNISPTTWLEQTIGHTTGQIVE